MEDSIIIQDFLNYLQFEKRFSPHTAKCYGVDLLQFGEFLTGRSDAGGLKCTATTTGLVRTTPEQPRR